MSCYQWESGTIKLPTGEFARVRQAVAKADLAAKEGAFAAAQEFWKGLTRKQQTDQATYRQAIDAWDHEFRNRPSTGGYLTYGRLRTLSASEAARERNAETWHEAARNLLLRVAEHRWVPGPDSATRGSWEPGSPRRVLQTDMDYPTNRTTTFHCDGATIAFDRETSSVHWDVGENNRAVESAHSTALAQVLFEELSKVAWTRGTGGVLSGNDEYNREAQYAGGGANYVTIGFGPVGAAHPEAWMKTADYRDSTGRLVRRDDFPGQKTWEKLARAAASGRQGRVPRGVRTGGQFAGVSRGESGVRLR